MDNVPAVINWESELKGAAMLVKSGLVPKDIRTAEAALFVIMAGRDMGLSPVQSLRSIKPVLGKLECSADLQLGLYHRSGGKSQWIKITETEAELKLMAPWSMEPHISRFTVEDAKRAELLSQPTWRKYPKAMLRSRAITQGLKDIGFLLGASVYAPGELGGTVTVDMETGEVLPGGEQQEPAIQITSTAGTVEAFGDQEREFLEESARKISEAIKSGMVSDALDGWNGLDTEEKVAVWAMLDRDVRKLLKAEQAQAKAEKPVTQADVAALLKAGKIDEANDLARSLAQQAEQKEGM